MIIILGVIYTLICLPPYNSNFRYFNIKSYGPITAIFLDLTVLPHIILSPGFIQLVMPYCNIRLNLKMIFYHI